jgi:hypothetical protein
MEEAETRRVIEMNPTAPVVFRPIALMDHILKMAKGGHNLPGWDDYIGTYLRRLADRDPDPKEMVIMISAMYLNHFSKGRNLFQDFHNFKRNLAFRVVRFVPGANGYALRYATMRKFGEWVHQEFARPMTHIKLAVHRKWSEIEEDRKWLQENPLRY